MVEPPDAVLLDVTGSERLFKGIDRLLGLVSSALFKLHVSHGVAVTPTIGAAWALASFNGGQIVLTADTLREKLSPLPVSALRLDISLLEPFHELGVETIGQLMRLPRDVLPARFGPTVLTRLDQALGRIPEPIVPIQHHEPVRAKLDIEGTVESLEMIEEIFRKLTHEIIQQLRDRGCGARKVVARFLMPGSPTVEKTILLSRPTCHFNGLFNLLRCSIETVKHGEGFSGFRLSVPLFERLTDGQLEWVDRERQDAESEFDRLLERLRVRLGEGAVLFPRLEESHMPEKAFAYAPEPVAGSSHPTAEAFFKPRPLHLLSVPEEVQCMSVPAEDGQPVSFRHGRDMFQVVLASGPERISGSWWEGRNKTRDYFDVEDVTGRRLWLFRVAESGRWFLHGLFDG
jgi:protein ImuB